MLHGRQGFGWRGSSPARLHVPRQNGDGVLVQLQPLGVREGTQVVAQGRLDGPEV
jgi:hypothetical protein